MHAQRGSAQIPALLAYAGLGATFALVACVGAVLASLIGGPRAATVAAQCWCIAAGAGASVCVGVLIAGALSAAITDSWEWYSFYAVLAIGTGVVAAVVAGGMSAFCQYRHRLLPSRQPAPDFHHNRDPLADLSLPCSRHD